MSQDTALIVSGIIILVLCVVIALLILDRFHMKRRVFKLWDLWDAAKQRQHLREQAETDTRTHAMRKCSRELLVELLEWEKKEGVSHIGGSRIREIADYWVRGASAVSPFQEERDIQWRKNTEVRLEQICQL